MSLHVSYTPLCVATRTREAKWKTASAMTDIVPKDMAKVAYGQPRRVVRVPITTPNDLGMFADVIQSNVAGKR